MKTSAITHANVTGFAPQLLLNIQLWNSLYFRAQLFEQLGPELQMQRGSRHVGWTNKRIHELGNVYIHGGDEKVTSISNLMSNLWLCFEKKKSQRTAFNLDSKSYAEGCIHIAVCLLCSFSVHVFYWWHDSDKKPSKESRNVTFPVKMVRQIDIKHMKTAHSFIYLKLIKSFNYKNLTIARCKQSPVLRLPSQ